MNQLLEIPKAAERLGLKARTIRRWVFLRKITYVKVGGAVRIPESEVARVIKEGTVLRLARRDWLPTKDSPAPARCALRRRTHLGPND